MNRELKTKMAPEQEALYALHWNVPRSELSIAAQLEYDRLRPAWEQGKARPAAGELEAARLAWEAQQPPAAPDRRDPPPVTRLGHKARTRTSEQVRDTTFQTVRRGYDMTQVDRLLLRIAAELDAGRPVERLVSNATFRTQLVGYDVAAVDRFLTEISTNPGRDLDTMRGRFTRAPSSRWPLRAPRGHDAEEYWKAWDEFDQQPGTYLRLEWVGIARRELRSAELQTIASISFKWSDFFLATNRSEMGGQLSIGEESFVLKTTRYAESRKLVDKTGTPILYTSGMNFERAARASISFPDERSLQFPVRGTSPANAIMTAVDEAGNSVARYRICIHQGSLGRKSVEVAVHPGRALTDELILAIVISAPWLSSYFSVQHGGG